MSLVAEVKKFFDKTILLSGCISTGRDVASAMQMGADLAYMGTRFINTEESEAPPEYRKMIIEAGASDVVYTAAISGVHANFLAASLQAAGISEDDLKKEHKIDFGKELDTEAKAWKTIWSAGQGVTTIENVLPVSELVESLKTEFKAAIVEQSKSTKNIPQRLKCNTLGFHAIDCLQLPSPLLIKEWSFGNHLFRAVQKSGWNCPKKGKANFV